MSVRHVAAREIVGGAGEVLMRIPSAARRFRRGLTVFLFHDVTDRPSPYQRLTSSSTSVSTFERQIRWVARHFDVIHPTDLLGGDVPPGSALVTFDDAWAGVTRTALPVLREHGVPALLFLNMATVAGDPDLAALSAYREMTGRSDAPDDDTFRAFQGATMTPDDLAVIAPSDASFGSHLFRHWRSSDLTDDEFVEAFERNASALAAYPNSVPLFAFPFGAPGRDFRPDQIDVARRLGADRVFTAGGRQNDDPHAYVLDRVWFPADASTARSCWYATHRERAIGRLRRTAT